MSKVLSAVFGIGIAVVVYVTLLLGIQAFYPAPEWNNYCDEVRYAEPYAFIQDCDENMTVADCRKQNEQIQLDKRQQCDEDYQTANENYGRNFFIIASVLGVIALIVSFFLFLNITSITVTNITAGMACSGIVMILWGFMRGWESTDEKLKFVVGLIIAMIVITLAVLLNKKEAKGKAGKKIVKKKR